MDIGPGHARPKRSFVAFGFLLVALLASGCAHVAPPKDGASEPSVALRTQQGSKKLLFIARLPALRVERIIYLQPWIPEPGARTLEGWQIAAERAVSPPPDEQQRLLARVGELFRASQAWAPMCGFQPRHALTLSDATHRYDVLVCFMCGEYEIYEDGELLFGGDFTTTKAEDWDAAFQLAGLRQPAYRARSGSYPKRDDLPLAPLPRVR